jgi:hypothetical protein
MAVHATPDGIIVKQDPAYRPTARQRDYGAALARQIRDLAADAPSAHSLSKYYSIDTLKSALLALREGKQVIFA